MSDSSIIRAEILSVGTELTVGDTRDTNAGDIANWLSQHGVTVTRVVALPDVLDAVRSAFDEALGRAELVVSTGGLGPTPDDLTREAIAAVCDETPRVDPDLEGWLRDLWDRRNLPFVEANLRQAWLIPSAEAIANPNGTAPGWWVERQGRVIVALPGPPREMRPMWQESVLPRLMERGLGRELEVRTFRTTGIGESLVVDRLGSDVMSAGNPIVTTYARQEAVDVRISALPDRDGNGTARSAREVADQTEAVILARLGDHVWGRGIATWAEALDELLVARDWRLATIEAGTRGTLANLLGDSRALSRAVVLGQDVPLSGREAEAASRRVRDDAGVEVGLALVTRLRGEDSAVTVAVATPQGSHRERRVVFLGGPQGRQRAAVAAAAILHTTLAGQTEVPR